MIQVYFKGYGYWASSDNLSSWHTGIPISKTFFTSGVFCLAPKDEAQYKLTEGLENVIRLLPNYSHPNSPVLDLQQVGLTEEDKEDLRFVIDFNRSPYPILKVIEQAEINTRPDKRILEEVEIPVLIGRNSIHEQELMTERLNYLRLTIQALEQAKINSEPDQSILEPAEINEPINNDARKGQRQQQLDIIFEVIKGFGYDPLNIPEGTKGKIKDACQKINPGIFSNNSFNNAWKEGNKREIIRVENKEKYLSNQ
ncbi:MAG: hypothetical protein ACXWT4_08595 [Methylobacter sp.]